MSKDNLYKGFEVELFTGSLDSHIGVSADIEKKFSDFVKEPDNRNVLGGAEQDKILLKNFLKKT